MAESDDRDKITFYGKDPLSPEAYQVLEQAKMEMTGWIKKTVATSTEKLKAELKQQASEFEQETKALADCIGKAKDELDSIVGKLEQQIQQLVQSGKFRADETAAAAASLRQLTVESEAALEARRKALNTAGRTAVNIITKFVGV